MALELLIPIGVSRLPDLEEAIAWEKGGYDCWISVCGFDLRSLSDGAAILTIPGYVFKLADPFSKSSPWRGDAFPNKQTFLAASTPDLRSNLVKAVRQASILLLQGDKVMVFCHLGQSRSPLVAAAAVMLTKRISPLEAWQTISDHFDVKRLTELSLSALIWLESDCRLDIGA